MNRGWHTGGVGATLCLAVLLAAGIASAEEAYVVEMGAYTLRAAPQLSAPSVGRLKVGERVAVTARTTGWAQVEAGELKGWIVESGIGSEPSASTRIGPLQERLTAMETGLRELEAERATLREENTRLGARAAEQAQSLERARKDAVAARSSVRFREMALGGALVILGWLAGYALRRRSGSSRGRYHIE